MQEMGRLAAQILLDIFSGGSPESNLTLPGKLIVRQSTAAPGAEAGKF
jgi:DNA-binding LacI/PurR family transcriptional regulator